MGQLESLLNGEQGTKLYNGGSFSGKKPPRRAGADAFNDIHTTGLPNSEHVHRDENIPFANGDNGLAVKATTLQGSKYNNSTPYRRPDDISAEF